MTTKQATRWVLTGALVVIVLLLALEAGGRLYMHARHGVPGKRYGRWRADPVLGARLAENVYDHRWQTNDWGFRNDEDVIEPKPEGCLRIVAYGGSTTICWNLATPQAWPTQLQQRLRLATGRNCHQVLNAGDFQWSISHIYARAQMELPRLRPDFVLLYTGINETSNAWFLASEGKTMGERVASRGYGAFTRKLPSNRWLVQHSFAYKFLHKVLYMPVAGFFLSPEKKKLTRLLGVEVGDAHPAIPPDPDILANYLEVLDRLIALCRQVGAEPVFIIQAGGRPSVTLDLLTSYSRKGARLAAERGVQVVDARRVLEAYDGDSMDLFREPGMHWSARGAALLAELIHSEVFGGGPAGDEHRADAEGSE